MTLIDNSTSTIAGWLQEHAEDEVRVATGFFTLDGLATLYSFLPEDSHLQVITAREIMTGRESLESFLKDDAESVDLNPELQRIYDTLGQSLSIRVHDDLHAKLYLTGERGIMGSSNLTIGGLENNIELNRELHPEIVREASAWFEDLWLSSDPFSSEAKKILEASSVGKDLVETPPKDEKRLRRAYGVGRDVVEIANNRSLPGQLARLDAEIAPTDKGMAPVTAFGSKYEYYEDLLNEAAQRRTQSADEFDRLQSESSRNTRHLWRQFRRAGEPCSVPIDPGGKLWLLDWFIKQDGNIPRPANLTRQGKQDGPVLMVNLWENQREAVEAWIQSGRDGIVEMATATGKTVVGLAAIAELCGNLPEFGSPKTRDADILTVVHTRALRDQWREEIENKLATSKSSHSASKRALELETAQVEIQTPQYISQNPSEFTGHEYDLVIYDEVHHYSRPEGWGKAVDEIQRDATLGLTATIGEVERQTLEERLGDVVYTYGLADAQEDGVIPDFDLFLHPVEFTDKEQSQVDELNRKIRRISSKISDDPETLSLLKDYGLSLDESSNFLSVFQQAYNKLERSKEEVEMPDEWQQLMTLLGKRREIEYASEHAQSKAAELAQKYIQENRKVVIFSMRVDETAKPIANSLQKSKMIHGEQRDDTIEKHIDEFRSWDSGALVAAKMLDEGIDLPHAEVGINVAGTKTRLHLVQRIGRLLRREGTVKPTFHHFMMADNEHFYRELAPVEPTKIDSNPAPNIKKTLPFKIGTVRVGKILESVAPDEARRLLEDDRPVTEIRDGTKWWLGILEEEHPDLFEAALREKADQFE